MCSFLKILGTLVVLEGNILFRDNRNYPDGISGALHLSAFGQIVLRSGTNLTFLNNTGRLVSSAVAAAPVRCSPSGKGLASLLGDS